MGKSTKKKQKAKQKTEEKTEAKSNKTKNQKAHRQDFNVKRRKLDIGNGNNAGIVLSGNQKYEASKQAQALEGPKTAALLSKERCNYVGLVNQGATCYLNTLLQTFFMTPEFKKILCRLPAEKNTSTSICYQLQKLFKELDEHHRYAVTTDGIIMSLGMNRQDVLEQQDLEEYFRLILNKTATELNGSDILQEKSFEEFLKAEILNGANMCYCDICKVKTETKSRYYFKQLPKILTLHLKRFKFDVHRMNYIKLNTSIDIPMTLNFLKKSKAQNQNADKPEWYLSPVGARSTVVYELFAICDHFGGYGAGHYVSRIKSSTNKWYCFNDSKVTEISSDFTKEKETDNASNGFHVSSSTAYMLMYRRKVQNTNPDCGENQQPAEKVKHISEDRKIEDGEGTTNGKEGEEDESGELTRRTALKSTGSNMKIKLNAKVDKEHCNLDTSTTIIERETQFQAGEQEILVRSVLAGKGKLEQSNPKEMEKARKYVTENRIKIGENTVKAEGNAEELIMCEDTAVETSEEPRERDKRDVISGGNEKMVEEDLRVKNQEKMTVGSKTLNYKAFSKRGILCCSFIVFFCVSLLSCPFHPYLLSLQISLVTSNLSSARNSFEMEPCPSRLPIPIHVQPVEGQNNKVDIKSTQVETHHWNESLSCGDQLCCPARSRQNSLNRQP
ncbi:ubiquitin carboxyl-terminal hydrolase 47-like isoform X2 [Heptranchias perlo]|uniref:ubiquitin carboxyl-terminal hydrolase 47-like isoform X2 n=1 Tax=Heptranchias perlo TaxID=212740 RepID=UPI00355ACD8A